MSLPNGKNVKNWIIRRPSLTSLRKSKATCLNDYQESG